MRREPVLRGDRNEYAGENDKTPTHYFAVFVESLDSPRRLIVSLVRGVVRDTTFVLVVQRGHTTDE